MAQLSSRLLATALDSGRLTLPVGALTACLGAALLLLVERRSALEPGIEAMVAVTGKAKLDQD